MSTDQPGPRRIRASDAEREQYVQIIRAAMTEGRLSLEDGEERLAGAYAAVHRDELDPLTDDLPDGGRRALFDTPQVKAALRAGRLRGAALGLGALALLAGLAIASDGHVFWPLIIVAVIGFKVARHARWRAWQRVAGEFPPFAPPWLRHRRGYRR
jgi:hypothetical protein